MQIFFFWTINFFFLQKSNRLSTKQDHRLSQKSLILKNGKKQKHSKKSTKKPTNVPLSLLIPRLELQDQSVLECDGTLHRAEKKPCGLSRLWRCCGSREDWMSDRQSTRRWMQGAPGWGCRWGFLGIWAWFATGLVLYFGYAAPLAQPPMSQQSVCARKVLQKINIRHGQIQVNFKVIILKNMIKLKMSE